MSNYPENQDDEIVNSSISNITKIYYNHVRYVAQRVIQELKEYIGEHGSENDEELTEQFDELIWQFCDENEWVFVNHLARITIVVSDNRDALFDDLDGFTPANKEEGTYDNTRAFWAFKSDVEEIVASMWNDLKGADPQAQYEQDNGIESAANDFGQ